MKVVVHTVCRWSGLLYPVWGGGFVEQRRLLKTTPQWRLAGPEFGGQVKSGSPPIQHQIQNVPAGQRPCEAPRFPVDHRHSREVGIRHPLQHILHVLVEHRHGRVGAVHRAVIPTLQGNNALKMVPRLVRGFGPSGPALPVPSPDRGYRGWSTSRRTPLPNPDVRTLAQRDESTPGQRSPSNTPPDIDPTSPTWPAQSGLATSTGRTRRQTRWVPVREEAARRPANPAPRSRRRTPFSWRLPR